jgi:hypothetical protein
MSIRKILQRLVAGDVLEENAKLLRTTRTRKRKQHNCTKTCPNTGIGKSLCNTTERKFCEQILRQCVSIPEIHPQYSVNNGQYYIDFAILFENGRKIALEIEGSLKYTKLGANQTLLDDHCRRHNELILEGWEVFFFTWGDILQARKTIATINRILT